MVAREDFGHRLLATIRAMKPENSFQQKIFMDQLEKVVMRTLGVAEEPVAPPPHFLPPTKSEFPSWRVKYEGGKEIARRAIYSFGELEQLIHEDPMFCSADFDTPVPPREG